ncbi:hypothetical protein [Parapedobacter soli]|uniref:hypothetical protein n=1 Tax=Parapedobacter soli TaxID=416955 RepID=UPI0021CA90B8|nr:hypothetical protein [Parapedobacter soli]
MNVKSKKRDSAAGFKIHKSYSPAEILAAGGTTAFGKKMGQSNEKIIAALEKSPEIDPFTEKEWQQTLKLLRDSK